MVSERLKEISGYVLVSERFNLLRFCAFKCRKYEIAMSPAVMDCNNSIMILLKDMQVNKFSCKWMDYKYALYCHQPVFILNCSLSGITFSGKYFILVLYFDQSRDLKVGWASEDFLIFK